MSLFGEGGQGCFGLVEIEPNLSLSGSGYVYCCAPEILGFKGYRIAIPLQGFVEAPLFLQDDRKVGAGLGIIRDFFEYLTIEILGLVQFSGILERNAQGHVQSAIARVDDNGLFQNSCGVVILGKLAIGGG